MRDASFIEIFLVFFFNLALWLGLKLVELVLYPINFIIANALPSLNSAFAAVADYITLITTVLGFAINALGIPPFSIALIGAYFLVKLTAPIFVFFIKQIIRWLIVFSIIRKI